MSTSNASTPDDKGGTDLEDALHRVWGFSSFRPLQREAMHAILAGRDSVVVLPTGGGKSLCFQAPALVSAGAEPRPQSDVDGGPRRGLAVVVSPLISLTPRPGGDRREEVYAACELLQALGLRSFSPSVTACPGCGRTTSSTFQELAERIQDYVRDKMPEWKTQYEGVEAMTLAVMGCVVNGPGESKAANIGISLPGTGEAPNCPVFIDGEHVTTLRGTYEELSVEFQRLVNEYVDSRYARR